MSKLGQAIGQLIGMSIGGPQGAALGSAAGTLFTGGSFQQALQSGIGSFVNSTAMGKFGPQMDMINAVMGMSGSNSATPQQMLNQAQAGAKPKQGAQGAPGQAQGTRPTVGGGISELFSNLGIDMSNPYAMATLLQAMEPRGSMLTPKQERQMATGERNPDYRGTALPEYRAMGGFIEGPGTGTSDSIPAMIYQNGGPVQEARLSDGEFVMTADAVRGAGGGNRAKGAAKMYQMMHQLEGRA